nr:response regulator [Oligoflexales bacterium]
EKVCQELRSRFAEIGMEVYGVVHDGVQALAFLEKNEVDLVSLDIIMPNMHGIECYKKIKLKRPNQRCIFISVLGNNSDFVDKYSEEIPSHLFHGKPVSADELIKHVNLAYGTEDSTSNEKTPHKEFSDVIKIDSVKLQGLPDLTIKNEKPYQSNKQDEAISAKIKNRI